MAEETLQDRIKTVLEEVRPSLQRDGGDVAFVDVKDGVVQVKLQGTCAGCPMSQMTLSFGIQRVLKERIPEIERVEAV